MEGSGIDYKGSSKTGPEKAEASLDVFKMTQQRKFKAKGFRTLVPLEKHFMDLLQKEFYMK